MKNCFRGIILIVVVSGFLILPNPVGAWQLEELKPTSLIYPTLKPIEGRVLDESGWPIVGAVVFQYRGYIYDPTNAVSPQLDIPHKVATDVRGKFKLGQLDHSYRAYFMIAHPEYPYVFVDPLNLFGDIVLKKGKQVSGQLLHHDGTPAKHVQIQAGNPPHESELGFAHGRTETDEDGRFTITLAPDSYVDFTVTLPESLEFKVKWYQTQQKAASENATGISAIGDEFEIRIPKPRSIEISVVSAATNEPVPIEKAFAGHNDYLGDLSFGNLKFPLNIDGNKVTHRFLREGLNRIWIHPKRESKHVAAFVDFELTPDQSTPENLEIKVLEGTLVSGKAVDELTGQPVANVAIQYLPSKPGALINQGVHVPTHVRTGDDGVFSLIAPAIAATLQIVGDCKDYQTLPLVNAGNKNGTVEIPPNVSELCERQVNPQPNEPLVVPTFKLRKAPVVSGVVLDENDRPLADATFVVDRPNEAHARSTIFGQTDKYGRFEIKNVFTNVLGPDLHEPDVNSNRKHNVAYFWHQELNLGKRVVLNEDELSLTVKLETSPVAWGRVVDSITREPVGGVSISARTEWYGLFSVGAITRSDGTFLLEHLPGTHTSANFTKQDYNGLNYAISFTPSDDGKLVLELEDLLIHKSYPFGKPAAAPDISDLSPEEALKSVTDYIKTELGKLPPATTDGEGIVQNRDSGFAQLLARKLDGHTKVLFAEEIDEVTKLRAAVEIFQAFGMKYVSYSTLTSECKKIIVENVESPGVFEEFKGYGFFWESPFNYQIFSNSTTPKIRQLPVSYLMSRYPHDFRTAVRLDGHRVSDTQFKETLTQAKSIWKASLNEFPDAMPFGYDIPMNAIARRSMEYALKGMNDPNIDEKRARIVREAIEAILNNE